MQPVPGVPWSIDVSETVESEVRQYMCIVYMYIYLYVYSLYVCVCMFMCLYVYVSYVCIVLLSVVEARDPGSLFIFLCALGEIKPV